MKFQATIKHTEAFLATRFLTIRPIGFGGDDPEKVKVVGRSSALAVYITGMGNSVESFKNCRSPSPHSDTSCPFGDDDDQMMDVR